VGGGRVKNKCRCVGCYETEVLGKKGSICELERRKYYDHDIEEILMRLKQLEENQEQITEILWDELKIKVWFVKASEL